MNQQEQKGLKATRDVFFSQLGDIMQDTTPAQDKTAQNSGKSQQETPATAPEAQPAADIQQYSAPETSNALQHWEQNNSAINTQQAGNTETLSSQQVSPQRQNDSAGHDSIMPITGNSPNRNAGQRLRKKYSSHSFAEICQKPEPVRYLISDYIQEEALHIVFGESGCGKSFTVLDMACCVACKEILDWHGMNLKHAPVLYFAGEGARGLRKRCAAWAQERSINPENVQLTIIDEVFRIDDDKDPEHYIDNTIDNIRDIYPNTGLIVIDTMHRYMSGDENKSFDIGKFYGACDRIIRELKCSVIIIHHTGNAQENKNRGRGSSSIKDDADIQIRITKSGSIITVDQTKNKDGIEKKGLKFNLKQVVLPPSWNDEYGKPSTSCVIELSPDSTHNQPYTPQAEAEKTKKPTEAQQRAKKTFRRAIQSSGVRIHDEKTGHDLAAVSTGDWRIEAYRLDSADKDNTKRQHFNLDRKYLYETAELLIKRELAGREYWCLDMQAEGEDNFRNAVIVALGEREKQEAEAIAYFNSTDNDNIN